MMHKTVKSQAGYTIAIVAALLVAAGTLTAVTLRNESASITTVKQGDMVGKLNTIFTAIVEYRRDKGVYPCPAPLNVAIDDSASVNRFGVSHASCSGSPAGIERVGDVWRGMVPVATLGLPRDMAEDNWGNKIQYAVHRNRTKGSLAIQIHNTSGAFVKSYDFTLVSTGSDERGAWSVYGTTENESCPAASSIATEKRFENCDNDTIYLDQPLLTASSAEAIEYYDDTVYFRDPKVAVCPGSPTTVGWSGSPGSCTQVTGLEDTFGDPPRLVIDSTVADTGSTLITCQADGSWATSSESCSVTPATGCTGTTNSTNTAMCNSTAGINAAEAACAGNGSGFTEFFHTVASGSPTTCNGGANVQETFTCCNPVCPNGQSFSWSGSFGANCTATVSGTATQRSFGQAARTINDTVANQTGSAQVTCLSSGAWSTPAATSCTYPSCPTQTLSWTNSGATCSASFASVATGSSRTASDSSGTFGSATATCVAGAWAAPTSTSCSHPACPTQSLSWTVGANTCNASFASVASGGSRTATDSVGPAGGTATAACVAGSWGTRTSATCVTPPPPPSAPSASGRAYSWGRDSNGRLGNGGSNTNTHVQGLVTTSALTTAVVQVSANGTTSCALNSVGDAFCWGNGSSGRNGDGTSSGDASTPRKLSGSRKYVSISSGRDPQCAVATDGSGWCWGENNHGGLGIGSTTDQSTPQAVQGGHTFTMISAGRHHSCGLRTDGQLWCWGRDGDGELGRGVGSSSYIAPIRAGTLLYKYVDAGQQNTCAIRTNDDGYCWGRNNYGQLGTGDTTRRTSPTAINTSLKWTKLSTGEFHTCGIATTGQAYCWGRRYQGSVGDGLTSGNQLTPKAVPGMTNMVDIAAGRYFTCAINSSNDMYCWGDSEYQKLAQSGTTDRFSPVKVPGSRKYIAVATGDDHTLALEDTSTCVTQTLSWTSGGNTCSASFVSRPTGASRTATDSGAPTTGSATSVCTNGTWGARTSTSCSAPAPCATQTLSWTSGGNTCSASFSGVASGSSRTATDSGAPTTGSATAACSNGTWGARTSTSCSAAASCGGTLQWMVTYVGAVTGMPAFDYWCGGGGPPGAAVNNTNPCLLSELNDTCGRHSSGARGVNTGRILECRCN